MTSPDSDPSTTAATIDPRAAGAILRKMRGMQSAVLEAVQARTLAHLHYILANSTAAAARYDRAVVAVRSGWGWRVQALSGETRVNRRAPEVQQWQRMLAALPVEGEAQILSPASLGKAADAWHAHSNATDGLAVVWIPIRHAGVFLGGLWLERWGGEEWGEDDLALLRALGDGYGACWNRFDPRGPVRRAVERGVAMAIPLLLIAALVYALAMIEVRLRVVAPCEVMPRAPWVVAAPLQGVIETIHAGPGQAVEEGDLLVSFDRRGVEEEADIAARQVKIIEAQIERRKAEVFQNPEGRGELEILQHRLAQEQIRLELARERLVKLEIRAPRAGTVVIDRPHEWRGRLVHTGERILMLVDPQDTRVRIWVPEADHIDLADTQPIHVVLNIDPRGTRFAYVEDASPHAAPGPDGVTAFRVDAMWAPDQPSARFGLRGHAILYGERVVLAYFLFRKPLAALRRQLGV